MAHTLTRTERSTTMRLSLIYACRMLGLFMILPVFAPYGETLTGATPFLIGLAIGIYGASQAVLQIPLGRLSDYVGRPPVIVGGLLLFVLGSVIAALSTHIDGVIAGRLLQGAGAIGSSLAALLADSTREETRTRAMGIIGMTVGFSFFIAMVLGPVLMHAIGLRGIFWLSALLGLLGIVLLSTLPRSPTHRLHRDAELDPVQFTAILAHPLLVRLNAGVLLTHAVLTLTFIALPFVLLNHTHLSAQDQWRVYLPALVIACIVLFPAIMVAEIKHRLKEGVLIATVLMGVTEIVLYAGVETVWGIGILLCVFFSAFSFLEATLPSLTSKIAPPAGKGTAMGIFSTAQFLGIFIGGLAGGALLSGHVISNIFLLAGALMLIWFIIVLFMPEPPYFHSKIIHIGALTPSQQAKLQAELRNLSGVKDVALIANDESAYLKVDKKLLNDAELQRILTSFTHP